MIRLGDASSDESGPDSGSDSAPGDKSAADTSSPLVGAVSRAPKPSIVYSLTGGISSENQGDSIDAEASTDSAEFDPEGRVGSTLGKYRVIRLLGRGGMGSVYEGQDTVLQRQVAIKILPAKRLGKPAVVERFMREAQVAGQLNHPNIITIYDVVRDESGCYIIMEMLNAGSAGSRLKTGPYPWLVATRIVADCCAALKIAHREGIVHRDIKPDNILFTSSGLTKLIDFGLVKLMEDDLHLTRSGAVCGTPLYMSPEQAQKKDLDPRSDIYSLGATYFALLTGWPPYVGLSVVQILLQHVQSATPNPRELISEIPDRCVRVLMRAMQKDRAQRYQSAAEMGADLEQILRRYQARRNESIFVIDKNAPQTPSRKLDNLDDSLEWSTSGRQTNPLLTKPEITRVSVVELEKPLAELLPPPSRRRMLMYGGGAALLVGGGILFGHQMGIGRSITRLRGKEPEAAGLAAQPPIKVGILHSLTGPLAVSERALADASLLATEEINQAGGLLGRRVQPIIVDGHSQVTANSAFAQAAERLLAKEDVAALFGGYGSAGRKAIREHVEKFDRLLFYPGQYEGLEESASIVYTGATPNQFAVPAVHYCNDKLQAKRYFLTGTDGLRSHVTNEILAANIKKLGGEVVGEHYARLGEFQFGAVVKQIEKARPQVILNMYVGDSSVAFLNALVDAEAAIAQIPVVSFLFGESELAQLGKLSLRGHYIAHTRFPASRATTTTTTLAQRFAKRYGDHRPVGDETEAAYYGVHLWAAAVRQAGTQEVNRVRQALKQQEYDLLGVRMRIDPSNQHSWKVFVLGKIGDDNRIEIQPTGDEAIPPLPFPGPRTRVEWELFSKELYERWSDNWANPQKPQLLPQKKPK